MDFHAMKRKELQALCKKHGVPANLTNREMADRLASIFKENEEPVPLEELSSNPVEICIEDKANAVKKQVKKVRFSPDNQTVEYEVSVYQQPRRRSRRQTLSINPAQALENALSEDIKKFEGCQSRVARTRVQNAVEEEIHTVSSPPVGRKRGRGGKKNKDAEEVANIGDSDGLELGLKEDVKNGHDKVTSGLSGRQLRSRKNVTLEDSTKIRNDEGGDNVHLLDESSEGKNVPKKSTRNARKGDPRVAFSSDVEKVEIVSRVTRQSRAQSKDVASMVTNEVKIVEVKDGNETEKPLSRTKRNSGKYWAKSATSVKSDTQVTKVQEQSEIDIAFVEPPECLRRHSSRRKSLVSQSCKGANKEKFLKEEIRKRSRTTELEAIVEDSSEVERDKYAVSSQQQAPLRRSRRKTVVLTAPAVEMANKEDIGGMKHLRAPLIGKGSNDELDAIVEDSSEAEREKYAVTSQHEAPSRRGRRKTVILTSPAAKMANKEDVGSTGQLRAPLLGKGKTEELLRKSSQNSSQCSISGTSKEDQISVSKSDQGAKQQMQEPILEEEETSAHEYHPVTQKPQRRSRRITSKRASVAPPNATAKGVEKQQQSNPKMETVEEEAAPTESLPSPGELPAGKDVLFVASECEGHKTNLDFDVSKQVVKSGDAPPFLNIEEDKDSVENMEETLTESSVQLVGPSTDQEVKKTAQKSMTLYEKENNLVEEDAEKFVNCGNIESEVNCMSIQTGKTTCVFEDANWSDPKRLKCESKGSHGADSSLITFPAESHGNEESGQEMKVEFESNVIRMDDLTSRDTGLSFADQKDLTAATSTFLNSEKELGMELQGGENTHFTSDNVTAAYSITPFGEAQIEVELKDTNVIAAESVKEEVSKLNKSSESIGLKSKLENLLNRAEELIAIDVSNREGMPHIECSVDAADNQESSAQSHSTTAETDAQKILQVMQSSYSNNVAPGTPFGPAPVKDKYRIEAVIAARSGMSDQERSEDPNPGNEFCIHESVLMYEENTGLMENAEKIRILEDCFESESSPSLNRRTNAIDDSNLVESRMVSFESSNSKVVSPEIASLADVFSSASQGGHAGKTSSRIELKKVLKIQETSENLNPINYIMDDEGIRTPVVEDQIEGKLENANMTIADTVEQVIFNDLLNELGESIVLKRGSEIPLKASEKVSATMFSDGEGIILTESSVKAEKQEYITEIDVVAAISGTPNTTEIKCRSSSDTATHGTYVGLTPQSQAETSNDLKLEKVLDLEESSKIENVVNSKLDKMEIEDTSLAQVVHSSLHLEDTDITAGEPVQEVVIRESDKTDVKEDKGLAQEDRSSVHSEDTNITAAEPVQEVVIWESHKSESDENEVKEDTGLAQEDQSLLHAKDTNITAAESIQAVVFCESDENEVKEDTSLTQEDQSSMHLEDTNITAAEPVQEVVFWETDKMEVKEDTGLAQEDQISMHSEYTNITAAEPVQEVVILEIDKSELNEDTGLAQEDQSLLHAKDTNIIAAESVQELASGESDKMEVKEDISLVQEYRSSLQLEDTNITAAEPVQEVVFWESDKTEVKEDTGPAQEDQSSMYLEDTNITAAEPVQEVVILESDKSELKEDTGLAQEDQSLLHAKDTNITAAESVQEAVFWESDKIEVDEDTSLAQEDQSSMHLEDTNITAAKPVQELVFWESDKMEVKEDTSLAEVDQSSMPLEDTNITAAESIQEAVFWESDKIEVDEDTSLAQVDQSSMHLEDTNITAAELVQEVVFWESDKMEVKEDTSLAEVDQSSMPLEDTNITAAESIQEAVFWESDKIEVDEDTSLAQVDQSSMHLEDTNITAAEPVQEVVFWESDKMEVKEDTSLAQVDQSSMPLEDTNITAAESVHDVVFWDYLNKVCESGGTKESRDSLKKAEETGTSDLSGIGMVQTESSVETNEMSEATGQTTIMAMQWSLSSHDKELISPLGPQVVSQDYQGTTYSVETDMSTGGCGMTGQLNNEENAKIVENEDTINTEKEFFVSGKNVTDSISEGKSRADGVYHPLSESIVSQCTMVKKMDISERSFNNVSGETQEKHICEVFDGEGTGPVSPEEKGIWNKKLLNNSFQHAINDMQEKSEAVCTDTRNRIPANILPQLALEQLDNESETSKQGSETGEVNARAFGSATQALPPEELTTPISSESFSMRPHDHALVDGETMDGNGISVSSETHVVQEDNMAEQIATSPLKIELTDQGGGNVDAELYEPNMSVTDPIFQETDIFGVPSTEYPEVISNEPKAMEAENYGNLDDQDEGVGFEHDGSSAFGVDGQMSTVGLTVDNISVVCPLESTLNSSYPQSGTKVDVPDINDSDAAKQLDTSFTIEETGVKDGEKTLVSYQRSLHGEQEDVSSSVGTPCSKLEISIEKEHPQAMDDINDVVGTKISTACKVTREEIDGCQTNSVGFNDVTDGSFEDESKIGLEELVGAKSDDCEGSMKTDTDLDGIEISDVNQSPCLDGRKNCNLETEEPNALPFPETIAGDSREVESCSKLNNVSSMKPEMVVDCSSDGKYSIIPSLENPDESNIFTNMELRLFFGVEDEVKNSDAKTGDTYDVALDMAITECNSRDTVAKSDVEETNFCVRKDGPEDTEETMELRNDFSGLDAAMADKSPFSKGSEIGKVVDGEEAAFRTELNLLNASAKMERSNGVAVKQLISSIKKSKSKPGLIQRTPKRPIFHDMKENKGSTKREKIGNRTMPKTSSKPRPPLQRI